MIRAAALLIAACGAAQAASWTYRIELDPAAPLAARVEVELPAASRAQDFSVQVRGLAQRLWPQIAEPRCDGAPLAPDSASAWRVHGSTCSRLSWTVHFRSAEQADIDVQKLESVFVAAAGFWLFSETTSLLRPVDDTAHTGEIEFAVAAPVHGGAPGSSPRLRRLPARHAAPGLYVIGELPQIAVREGGAETTHVIAGGADLRRLVQEQRQALRYLTQAARLRPAVPWHNTVVWLAGKQTGELQVVAGAQTLLVSAAVDDGRVPQFELALLHVLREQLLLMMPAAMPLWVRESLAQYYAIKAMRRLNLPAETIGSVERRYIDPLRRPAVKLREAQRRIVAGDTAQRAELHAGGATFWDRLDRAIVRKSGFRTLDSALPRLLAASWSDDRLPPAILERLYRYAGSGAVDELQAFYVGE